MKQRISQQKMKRGRRERNRVESSREGAVTPSTALPAHGSSSPWKGFVGVKVGQFRRMEKEDVSRPRVWGMIG